jgi:quinol-cytochrome oxidoreductase complex cytochrome b subunit
LGGITFTCFIIQVATDFAMTFYYRPTVTEAFFSVQYIMNEVNFGWLIRSIHRWSASMMVLMMIYGSDNINYATFSFGISLIYFLIQNRFFSILLNIE